MANITIEIKAPELAYAIVALAQALEGRSITPDLIVGAIAGAEHVQQVAVSEGANSAEDNAPWEAETKDEPTPTVTLEEVRAKLAGLSQSGKQAEVKTLIKKFGAKKLTEIPKEKYPELLALAEAM